MYDDYLIMYTPCTHVHDVHVHACVHMYMMYIYMHVYMMYMYLQQCLSHDEHGWSGDWMVEVRGWENRTNQLEEYYL